MSAGDPDVPLDAVDAVVLGNVRDLWDSVDPMPDEVIDMVGFALDLAAPDVTFLHTGARQELAAARGDEQTRLITFDGTTLSIMISITADETGTSRIDGWITPAAVHPIELRTETTPLSTTTDATGRFSFTAVHNGLVQLVVRNGGTVTTQSILVRGDGA